MRTNESDLGIKSRGRCYGDQALFMGFKQSTLIRQFLMGRKEAPYKALSLWFDFNRAVFSYNSYVITRYNIGSQKLGLIFFLIMLFMQLSLNSMGIPMIFKPIAAYGLFFLPIWYDGQQLLEMFLINTYSIPLTVYTAVYFVMGLIHLIRIWLVKEIDLNSSGESLLYQALSKTRLKISPTSVAYGESLLFLALGILSWRYWEDPYFGFFLIITGISSWSSEFVKNAEIEHEKSITTI